MPALRNLFVFLTVFLLCICSSVAVIYGDTHTAKSCSYSDVSSAIGAASSGDTVSVPSGSCVWNSPLSITKEINLIGPGSTALTIRNSFTCTTTSTHMIVYTPSNPSADTPFRISGFTFDGGGKCSGILLNVARSNTPQTKVRIDHNVFQNHHPTSTTYGVCITNGGAWGVVDNNILNSNPIPVRNGNGNDNWWNNLSGIVPGSDENMYFEDNTINVFNIVTDCQVAERYAFRYNTINYSTTDYYQSFDLHGNTPGHSCFGAEVYGNYLNLVKNSYGGQFFAQRGGAVLAFYNEFDVAGGTVYSSVREEYNDTDHKTTNVCPSDSDQQARKSTCSLDGQHQHVDRSYYWINRKNATGALINVAIDTRAPYVPGVIAENAQFWHDAVPFNGTVGVGCGTLASRPATCTKGVGYWATNQSCSNLTGMVGKNPATPISGTLYKCTATNTWAAYYTPYTYPHPLRQGEQAPPKAPVGFEVK